jgi:magnesium transporter
MLKVLREGHVSFASLGPEEAFPPDALWIELISPTSAEEHAVEAMLGLALPTREEMAEIEVSSRLYVEDGGLFMTASVVVGADGDTPALQPVTFVLAGERLVTIRYVEPKSFAAHIAQMERQGKPPADGAEALIGLLEAIVDRAADVLERASEELDAQSRLAFSGPRGGAFSTVLKRLGLVQSLTSKVRGSLASLSRIGGFAALNAPFAGNDALCERLTTLGHDISSLSDHAGYVSAEITFLLNSTLGLISIEQNQIFKVLAAFSAVLMPPTLIAGIYGMNFAHMPELEWRAGYPMALLLMALAMAAPLVWFRRKGWF